MSTKLLPCAPGRKGTQFGHSLPVNFRVFTGVELILLCLRLLSSCESAFQQYMSTLYFSSNRSKILHTLLGGCTLI